MEKVIEIRNLTYKYKNEEDAVFSDVSISLSRGIWSLEGENGTGKSSFYKLLTNKFEDEGQVDEKTNIRVKGSVVLLNDSITVPGNLSEKDIAEYIFYINGIKGIHEYKPMYLNKPIGAYSVGERKLAVLRIMSYLSIDVLLIDEYLTNIDEKNIEEVLGILFEFSKNNTLIIISSNEKALKDRFKNKLMIEEKGIRVMGNE